MSAPCSRRGAVAFPGSPQPPAARSISSEHLLGAARPSLFASSPPIAGMAPAGPDPAGLRARFVEPLGNGFVTGFADNRLKSARWCPQGGVRSRIPASFDPRSRVQRHGRSPQASPSAEGCGRWRRVPRGSRGSSPPPATEASWRAPRRPPRLRGGEIREIKGKKKKKAKGRGRGAQGGELEAAPRGLEAPLRKSSELGLQESRQD